MTENRNMSDGFRRILYDAMVLSNSLKIIKDSPSYTDSSSAVIDGNVEANHTNALIQIRSMLDFLNCKGSSDPDTMRITDFADCTKQSPIDENKKRISLNKYAAHKSWAAVNKNAPAGVKQLNKKETVELGIKALDGFDEFYTELKLKYPQLQMNEYAKKYEEILNNNYYYIKQNQEGLIPRGN